MIESIKICDEATFRGTHLLKDLRDFNFLYGANAVGKTTISKLVAKETAYPKCKVTWRKGDKLDAYVYNRDFVAANFSQGTELKGIFTLGEENVELLKSIETAKGERDKLAGKLTGVKNLLDGENGVGGERKKLDTLADQLTDKCWEVKKKYDADFKEVFDGLHGTKSKFRDRALKEQSSNKAKAVPIEELRKKKAALYGEVQSSIAPLATLDFTHLTSLESTSVLATKVIGKEDSVIAELIKKLDNSDWVKTGRAYLEKSDGKCPFCQETAPANLQKMLEDYFDESFLKETAAIEKLEKDYKAASTTIKTSVQTIAVGKSTFLNLELFERDNEALDAAIKTNLTRIDQKKKESSLVVTLEPVTEIGTRIVAQITAANAAIKERNTTLASGDAGRVKLAEAVWRHLLDGDLKEILSNYAGNKAAIEKTIADMTKQAGDFKSALATKEGELLALQKRITSVEHTINAVNVLLKSLCFQSFSLALAGELTYKLVRADGTSAQETLSEGEKTFITFLYFYHLIKGSDQAAAVQNSRIVVFDDPVSSLDADVLHIVSCLIKGILDDVREKKGYVKQVFVLTHNVYFHKEVTYNKKRQPDRKLNEETFWIVRKRDELSSLEPCDVNPINTCYDLIWAEVARTDHSRHSVQNTLRRALESAFNILGKKKLDKLHEQFEGPSRQICRCLLSWINDGSHLAHDDLFVAVDEKVVEIYKNVFRLIFEKAGFIDHYNLMMGIEVAEEAEEAAPPKDVSKAG
jgi:wobble nucleotide-excising tRNase